MGRIFAVIIIIYLSFAQIAHAKPVTIVVVGDSLVSGHGISKEQAFPAILEYLLNKKGYTATVINQGVSGDTSRGGLKRIDRAINQNPDIVILELGINDVFKKRQVSEIKENLEKIIEKLQDNGIKILLAGMAPPPHYPMAYQAKFKNMYAELADDYDLLFQPFFLQEVAGMPQYNNGDGIHPNPIGVKIMVKNIAPYVEKLIRELE